MRLAIDHGRKVLRMRVQNAAGKHVQANMDLDQIAEFITILSHCQHALVLSQAGHIVDLPLDPQIAFKPQAGTMLLGAYEGAAKMTVGVDDLLGAVSLLILSPSGRLSGFRIAPEMARDLGNGLVEAADKIVALTKKQ